MSIVRGAPSTAVSDWPTTDPATVVDPRAFAHPPRTHARVEHTRRDRAHTARDEPSTSAHATPFCERRISSRIYSGILAHVIACRTAVPSTGLSNNLPSNEMRRTRGTRPPPSDVRRVALWAIRWRSSVGWERCPSRANPDLVGHRDPDANATRRPYMVSEGTFGSGEDEDSTPAVRR